MIQVVKPVLLDIFLGLMHRVAQKRVSAARHLVEDDPKLVDVGALRPLAVKRPVARCCFGKIDAILQLSTTKVSQQRAPLLLITRIVHQKVFNLYITVNNSKRMNM